MNLVQQVIHKRSIYKHKMGEYAFVVIRNTFAITQTN